MARFEITGEKVMFMGDLQVCSPFFDGKINVNQCKSPFFDEKPMIHGYEWDMSGYYPIDIDYFLVYGESSP